MTTASLIREFTDPDAFGEAFRARGVTIMIERSGAFHGSVMRTELSTLWLQRGAANMARASRAILTDRVHFAFIAESGHPQIWNGRLLEDYDLFCHVGSDDLFIRNTGSGTWGSVSLRREDLEGLGFGGAARDLAQLGRTSRIGPMNPASLHRLRAEHLRIERMTRRASATLTAPAVVRQCNDRLARALGACVNGLGHEPDRASARRHHAIMRQLRACLRQRQHDPITLTELCALLGVNARTLNLCCHEFLGTSPVRYLRLRRFHMARRALRRGIPGVDTVTGIALHHGFAELGRFAQTYCWIFGELPSDTLNRID